MVRRQRFIYGKSLFGHRKCPGLYWYCTRTTKRVPGVHLPRRALWAEYGGEPAPRWARRQLPPRAHAPGVGGNPKGGAPLGLGGKPPPLAAAPL